MSEQSERERWNWQWTATFVVVVSFGVSGILWTRGFRIIASAVTVAATLLGMYVVYEG